MLPVPDVSSPQLGDKHRGYTDLLHPICDVRSEQWRRHHKSSWHVSSPYGTRHAVHGTDGSQSRVRPVAPGNGSELTCHRRSCALVRSATKAHARRNAFRALFLGDDDVFRICRVECRCVCLWPGYNGDLWRMVPCFCHWSTLAIRVGGRVACTVVVFAIFKCYMVLGSCH